MQLHSLVRDPHRSPSCTDPFPSPDKHYFQARIAMLGEADKVPAFIMAAHGWHGCLCPRILSAEMEAWMGPEKVEPNILGPPIQADPVEYGARVDVMVHSSQKHTDGGAWHSEPTLLRKPSFYVVPRRATALFTRVITCAMSLRLLKTFRKPCTSNWACGSHIPPLAAVGSGSVQSTFAVQTAHVTLFVW